jgi:T6SS, Phospholipase effector Tle1-like, catalytic domain
MFSLGRFLHFLAAHERLTSEFWLTSNRMLLIAPMSVSKGRNIVILADGTGQRGGITIDERRSNIFNLYRATRCGPDSSFNPTNQLACYDPGIGTLPDGLEFFGAVAPILYNMISQATGLRLTKNIVDCYDAIIQLWRPGDRIFLFGFSRGAYTVRCQQQRHCPCLSAVSCATLYTSAAYRGRLAICPRLVRPRTRWPLGARRHLLWR